MKYRTTGIILLLLIALAGALLAFRPKTIAKDSVLLMDLGGNIPEVTAWNPWFALFEKPPLTVLDKVMMLRKARHDSRLQAVVIRITDFDFGLGKTQEFRQAILDFKQSHKPIVAYLEVEGGGNLEYYLATACDQIYVSEESFLGLNGLSSFHFFLGGLWEKIYLEMQVDQIQEYKNTGDMLARREMSPAHREAAESLLDSLNAQFLEGLARGRGKSTEAARAMVDGFWMLPPRYLEAGWIDGISYLDQVLDRFKKDSGRPRVVREEEYETVDLLSPGFNRGPKVKVLYGVGSIVRGDPGGAPFGGQILASDRMVQELQEAAEDDSIKAVILRVDSPGGSALASDLVWRATQKVREKKPLVVSMSDAAASGGYYIACAADAIVAEPGTLTGSIGVFTAHLSMERLLQKAGVGTALLTRGTYAGYDRLSRPLSAEGREKAHAAIAGIYEIFTRKVAQGRNLPPERVNEIGRGRVWTGAQAKELGLVDELGGMIQAMAVVKQRLGVAPDKDLELVWKRPPVSLWKLLTGKVEEAAVRAFLNAEEIRLLAWLRQPSLWRSGEPLALMEQAVFVH